jgi:hypothetical protein
MKALGVFETSTRLTQRHSGSQPRRPELYVQLLVSIVFCPIIPNGACVFETSAWTNPNTQRVISQENGIFVFIYAMSGVKSFVQLAHKNKGTRCLRNVDKTHPKHTSHPRRLELFVQWLVSILFSNLPTRIRAVGVFETSAWTHPKT